MQRMRGGESIETSTSSACSERAQGPSRGPETCSLAVLPNLHAILQFAYQMLGSLALEVTSVLLVNLLLFHPVMTEEEIRDADEAQTAMEMVHRKKCEAHNYVGGLTSQAEGPLRRFVVDHLQSRKSR